MTVIVGSIAVDRSGDNQHRCDVGPEFLPGGDRHDAHNHPVRSGVLARSEDHPGVSDEHEALHSTTEARRVRSDGARVCERARCQLWLGHHPECCHHCQWEPRRKHTCERSPEQHCRHVG